MEPNDDSLTRLQFLIASGVAGALAVCAKSQDPLFLVEPGDKHYESLRSRYNTCVDLRPAAIAPCTKPPHVMRAVQHANRTQLPIAIRSGGHSFEGFSSNDKGLVIDLSRMDRVQFLDGNRIAVEPGCTLAKLNDELLPRGRLLPAGSCGTVGIAGLALGGGYGFFSRKLGLTCDSLEALSLIDAAGKLRSTKDDPELLWACRGGGNGSFGVVIEMVFRTHTAPVNCTRHRLRVRGLDLPRASKLLEAWFEHSAKLPPSHFSAFVLNHTSLLVLVFGHGDEGPAVERFLRDFGELCDETQRGTPQPLAKSLVGHYGRVGPLPFKNASAGLYRDFDDLRKAAPGALDVVLQTPGLIFQVNTLGGAIADPAAAAVSSYPHRDRPWLGELQAYWDKPAQKAPLLDAFKKTQNILRVNGITSHYANYPDIAFTDWEQAYYGGNYERLRAVKRRYDPDNRFRHPQSVRP
ncbi:FAD-binding protein [Planctomycetota bacterium]|nr:FAD-binding protein [Planctomycetota bacterium]